MIRTPTATERVNIERVDVAALANDFDGDGRVAYTTGFGNYTIRTDSPFSNNRLGYETYSHDTNKYFVKKDLMFNDNQGNQISVAEIVALRREVEELREAVLMLKLGAVKLETQEFEI